MNRNSPQPNDEVVHSRVDVFSDPATLAACDRPDSTWNRLALATPQPDPFCATTAWQLSWREAVDLDRPVVVRANSDGLVQFAVHQLDDAPVLGPIERQWLFGCNVLGPSGVDLLAQCLSDPPVRVNSASCPIVVSGLDPRGPVLAAMKSQLAHMAMLQPLRREIQCAASLDGGLDGFLARRSANHRKKLRQALRRAAESGVAFERHAPASAEEARRIFRRMLAVERLSWKGIERCGMDQPWGRIFYGSMLRRLAMSASGRVMFATHAGQDIGYIFGGMAGDIYRGQQFSFDNDWRDMSIGNLLQYEQVAWLSEQGAARYDMGPLLGPLMAYKRHWTEIHLPIEAWLVRPV